MDTKRHISRHSELHFGSRWETILTVIYRSLIHGHHFTCWSSFNVWHRLPHPDLDLIVHKLTTFDSSKELERFSQNSYNCEICMSSIKGARCILLSCSHVFCRSCLVDFWGLCITEGDVGRVGCPDPQCVKDGREANEEEVRRVVTEEQVRRWKWLRQKRAMEKGK